MADAPQSGGVHRQTFLARVRRSLDAVPRDVEKPPDTEQVAETDPAAREDLLQRFVDEARAADSGVTHVASLAELRDHLAALVGARNCQVLMRADTPLLRSLEPEEALRELGVSVFVADEAAVKTPEALRNATERAQIGLTEADWAVAESGTLALVHRPGQGRAVSLLPMIHIAVLPASRVVADLPALFEKLSHDTPPSAVTLITGPSRTADIEMVITRGVHGPGELHVIVLDDQRG